MSNTPRHFSKTALTASTPRYNAVDIAQARREADIVKLVAEKVSLFPYADEYIGRCPFHADSGTHLHVVPRKRIYHCLRCGAKGDAVEWLQATQQLSFVEAIEHIRCARQRIQSAIADTNRNVTKGK